MLLNFFVRTAILLNRFRCTAILSALQAGEEAESGRTKRISRRHVDGHPVHTVFDAHDCAIDAAGASGPSRQL